MILVVLTTIPVDGRSRTIAATHASMLCDLASTFRICKFGLKGLELEVWATQDWKENVCGFSSFDGEGAPSVGNSVRVFTGGHAIETRLHCGAYICF